jgi:hypothetical protein
LTVAVTGQINIRPTTSVYATYQRLSYKPWFAIAEFVDNSTQSYMDHRDELLAVYQQSGGRLRVEVEYDDESHTLTVFDNAFGMEIDDFTRALVLDSPPAKRHGRSEFGMGLKTAASWFGKIWRVETTRLGSDRKLAATIDVEQLARNRAETVPVEETPADPREHYTRITVSRVLHPVRTRTSGRVRDQLGSMYRQDLRSGEIEILWNGLPVSFEDPPILEETLPDGTPRCWRKDVAFEVPRPNGGAPLPVCGWIGIRDPGKQRDAGLVLLRRNRVIIGGPDEGYRPAEVFGQPNSFRYQRLIGELHMDDWPVTQAKDDFDWADGLEDAFIERLQAICKEYGDYAESYRSGRGTRPVTQSQMEAASERTRELFSNQQFGAGIAQDLRSPQPPLPPSQPDAALPGVEEVSKGPLVYELRVGTDDWIFRLHWQDQVTEAHWMGLSYPQENEVDIYLNTAHPFFAPYLGQPGMLELLQKLVVSLALAECLARMASPDGRITPSDFRNYMNRVLRRAAQM